MKKVFATGIIYIVLFILLIISVYNIGKELNDSAVPSGEVIAATEESSSENKEPEKENEKEDEEKYKESQKEKDKIEDKVVVKGDISKNVTPFNYKTTADKYLLDLCYAGLCEIKDRRCISSNVQNFYNEKRDITTFRITLDEDCENVSGQKITADDVLFNYYLRADSSYTADESITSLPIVGMQEYKYGIKNIKNIRKKISYKLKNPDKKTAALIKKNIIRPVLEEEYKWVCSLYGQEMYDYITEKYPHKKDLFVYFFAYGTDYKTKGKNAKKVINDIIKSYDTNYVKLGKVTGENYKKKAENIALYSIQNNGKKFKYRVKSISGIKKVDNNIIEIDVNGKRKTGFAQRLGSMYIVSMQSWGNEKLFNGVSQFGFKRGRADVILKKESIVGDETGNYAIKEIKDNVYTLEKRNC